MNRIHHVIFVLIVTIFVGCTKSSKSIVEQFYTGYNTGNYQLISGLVGDTLTLTAGKYVMPYSRKDYYTFFQWDSTFHTTYEITELAEENQTVWVTISSSSERFEFLDNNPLTTRIKLTIANGHITHIEELESPGANWEKWTERRDTLVTWIDQHHPELSGFINDMTKVGAEKYKQAIQLYTGE